MGDGRWEDVSADCLVNIFERLDLESLLLSIPFVCKTWYQVVLNHLCLRKLDFPDFRSILWRKVRYCDRIKLMKFAVKLSRRRATSLVIWNYCTTKELTYLSDECPALKRLVLPKFICCDSADMILSFIIKWKNLKFLSLESGYYCTKQLIKHISIYLPHFIGLRLERCDISEEIVSEMVSLLPRLMYLTINHAVLDKKDLLLILKGCKQLVLLDVRNCIGFDDDDEEILKFSSIIRNFQCDGSRSMKKYPYY